MAARLLPWREATGDAAAPLRGDGQRVQQVREQARVADRRGETARPRARFAASSDKARISASAASLSARPRLSMPAWTNSPGPVLAEAEHGSTVGVGHRPAEVGRGEVFAAERDRVFGPQGTVPCRTGRSSDRGDRACLRRIREKAGRRLQQCRLTTRVSRADEMRDQRVLTLAIVCEGKRRRGGDHERGLQRCALLSSADRPRDPFRA